MSNIESMYYKLIEETAEGTETYGHQQMCSVYDQHSSILYHLVCTYLGEELFDPFE